MNFVKIFLFSFLLVLPVFAGSPLGTSAFGTWRPTQGDLYDALRANAPHYWGWLKSHSSARVFSAVGVVTGDAHILNFGDIELVNGGREYGLIDMDNSGSNVPLIGDFLYFYLGTQLSSFKTSDNDLWKAYCAGLQGQIFPAPAILNEVASQTANDFSQNQLKYIKKMTNGNSFSAKAGLVYLDQVPAEILDIYRESQADFLQELRGQKILDIGYKEKAGGGSQGLARFWYLLKNSSGQHIWEFKLEDSAATSLYSQQPLDPLTRFSDVAQIYRPIKAPMGPYKFLKADSRTFLLRERFKSFLKLDPTSDTAAESIQQGQQVSIYIANKMGLWQSGQNGGKLLADLIGQDPMATYNIIRDISISYIRKMKEEQALAGL